MSTHQESAATSAAQAVRSADELITHPFRRRAVAREAGGGGTPFDQQVAALQRVAQSLGRHLAAPTAQQRQRANLRAYAHNGGLIVRKVDLPQQWWRQDFGPLVVIGSDGVPTTLIPTRGRYRLIDVQGASTRVTAGNAEVAAGQALSVIPQLPEPVTNPWQVGRYGLTGNVRWLALGTVISLLAGLITMTVPLATKAIWDEAVPDLDYSLLWGVLAFLAAASFAGMALKIIDKFVALRVGSRYRAFVTPAVWFRLQRIKSSYFRQNPIGVVSQQAGLVPGLFKLTTDPLFAIIGLIGFGIPSLTLMYVFSPQLTLVALIAVAVQVIVAVAVSWRTAQLMQLEFPLSSKVTNVLHGLIAGIVALRITGTEAYGLGQWAQGFHQRQRVTLRLKYLALGVSVFGMVWPIVVTSAIYVVTGTTLLGEISVGTFLAFMSSFGFFKAAAGKIPATISVFFALSKVWQRCSPIFNAPLERPLDAIDPGELTGQIDVANLGFGYDKGRAVLTDVNLHIAPGTFVALVGPSGSGKSTLARLLLGLEDPLDGSISYNGVDFARLDVDVVRLQLGVVTQQMRPYGDTVRQVIDGDRELAEDVLWQALAATGLADTVRGMAMGLDTFIGAAGQALSGGEVQRLLLARALAGDPRILILDEATSALDDIVQRDVMVYVRSLAITRVVVAQRLSTIVGADQIVVLDRGTVAETGSYDALIAKGGVFAGLIADQRVGD